MIESHRDNASQGLIGRISIQLGILTENQVSQILFIQSQALKPKLFGVLAVKLGMISKAQQEVLLETQAEYNENDQRGQPVKIDPDRGRLLTESVAEDEPDKAPPPELVKLLAEALDKGASDVHLQSGSIPFFRVQGEVVKAEQEPTPPEIVRKTIKAILTRERWVRLETSGGIEFVWDFREDLRLRVSCFDSFRGLGIVFRVIPATVPTLNELHLPRVIARLATYSQGLGLIVGPAGCGKSSTVAALVRLINEERKLNIIILEELTEYIHIPVLSNIIHRQIPDHAPTFGHALRSAFREDPDVIVVGEMRELETIALAISAAETGHLVLGTLHTNDCVGTIDRIVGTFPFVQQPQIRAMLSESLRGIVSQKLIPRRDGTGRVPAVEVLFNTPSVAQLIRSGTTYQLPNAIQMGRDVGMRNMAESLKRLYRVGLISMKESKRGQT